MYKFLKDGRPPVNPEEYGGQHPLKIYTWSTMLFQKYSGANDAVTNFMSHFSMLIPTNATVKLDNGNTVHAQVIGIILCPFPSCPIIHSVELVYYFPDHPYNTISLVHLKLCVGF